MLAYQRAQLAVAELKAAVYQLLNEAPLGGLGHRQVGRSLGIHGGRADHQGDVARGVLAMMEADGVVEQDLDTGCWRLRPPFADEEEGGSGAG